MFCNIIYVHAEKYVPTPNQLAVDNTPFSCASCDKWIWSTFLIGDHGWWPDIVLIWPEEVIGGVRYHFSISQPNSKSHES